MTERDIFIESKLPNKFQLQNDPDFLRGFVKRMMEEAYEKGKNDEKSKAKLYSIYGQTGNKFIDIQINGSVTGCPNDKAVSICSHYIELIVEEMLCESVKNEPDFADKKQKLMDEYTKLFSYAGVKVYSVTEIPNEYCAKNCCLNKPWALFETNKGSIKIGWRKRVLHISWIVGGPVGNNLPNSPAGNKLPIAAVIFPDENVTKYDGVIHAWGYDKAVEYLKKIHNWE